MLLCICRLVAPATEGYLAHYRKTCQKGVRNCAELVSETVEDTAVLRFKEEMVRRVGKTMGDLGWRV